MLLRIVAPHFVAGAIFEKQHGVWQCVRCAPIIDYLKPMPTAKIKAYLEKKQWAYEWLP